MKSNDISTMTKSQDEPRQSYYLKFGRKNGIFWTEQAKNEGKMQIPYILTDLFWVFWGVLFGR